MTVYDGAPNSVGSAYRIQLDKGSQSGKKHRKIVKGCPMSMFIDQVSSCPTRILKKNLGKQLFLVTFFLSQKPFMTKKMLSKHFFGIFFCFSYKFSLSQKPLLSKKFFFTIFFITHFFCHKNLFFVKSFLCHKNILSPNLCVHFLL